MDITGYLTGYTGRTGFTQFSGAFYAGATNPGVGASDNAISGYYSAYFKAAREWTGNTSADGGDTSKPATIAIMWILRFI